VRPQLPCLRLLTYNIRKGKGASGRADGEVSALAAAVGTLHPDIVLCQEVFHGATPRLQQSTVLADSLDMAAYYVPNNHVRRGHYGNATLSALPLLAQAHDDISTNRLERRGVMYTCLQAWERPLHLFNVHLGLSQRQRLHQVRRVAQLMAQRAHADDAVVIAGDFNDWTGRIDAEVTQKFGLHNAFANVPGALRRTFPAGRPLLKLDRVYVRHLQVRNLARPVGPPWAQLSDHLPLWAELVPDGV
jgi:endonuclease/exonuclease/phosphatase family metal-dependent hydrolase